MPKPIVCLSVALGEFADLFRPCLQPAPVEVLRDRTAGVD